MPLSDRFTRSTSDACSSIDRFLWMTPMPPCCAMAMASRDSVTVSMAALTSGTFSRMLRVSRVLTSTWSGRTLRMLRHQQHVVEGQGRRERLGGPRGADPVDEVLDEVVDRVDVAHSDPLHKPAAVTFLVLLAAAARTRIVASDLGLLAPHGLHRGIVSADPGGCRPALDRGAGASPRGHPQKRAVGASPPPLRIRGVRWRFTGRGASTADRLR